MPNPYDVGSAKYLASLGFPAIATSSAGMAFAMGKRDGGVTRAETLRHIADLVAAVGVPVNADFEDGFARDAEGVGESVRLCIGAGVAGLSIEDYPQSRRAALRAVRGGRASARRPRGDRRQRRDRAAHGPERSDLAPGRGRPSRGFAPRRSLRRGRRRRPVYARREDSRRGPRLVRVAGKLPVNVVMGAPGLTKQALEDLGVKRISTGGALARVAWGAFMRAASDVAEHGRFDAFAGAPPAKDIEGRSEPAADPSPSSTARPLAPSATFPRWPPSANLSRLKREFRRPVERSADARETRACGRNSRSSLLRATR